MIAFAASVSAQKQKNHNFEVAKNLDIFNNIYKHLDLMYVDTLNPKEVIGNGINAMLRSLDPYTEYYPEDKTKDLKMMSPFFSPTSAAGIPSYGSSTTTRLSF